MTDFESLIYHRFREQQRQSHQRTDRLFAVVLVIQWLTAVAVAVTFSPRAWAGVESRTHPHVLWATVLGGVAVTWPVCLSLLRPAAACTRHSMAVGQMLLGVLLIHLTGGRIESHFHVFGSLAFLSTYRDWRVLLTASALSAADHILRGIYWPQSIYGVLSVESWRWTEHAGWILFTDAFLIPACMQGVRQMREIARGRAEQDLARGKIEDEVKLRTAELVQSNQDLHREIAERRAVETSLRASEERFALAVQGSSDGIWDWNCQTGELYCSARFKELLGYEDDEFGDTIDLLDTHLHQDDRKGTWQGLHNHLDRRVPYRADFRLRMKAGSFRWFQSRGQALWDDDGRPVRMVGSICDITDQMRAELELRELNARQERRLRRLVALQKVDVAISASLDLGLTLGICLEQTLASLEVDAGAIWLLDRNSQVLECVASHGVRSGRLQGSEFRIGEGTVGHAALHRELLHIPDLKCDDAARSSLPELAGEGFATYLAVPLLAKGRITGVLEVCHRDVLAPDAEWHQFLKTQAVQAAIAIDNAHLFESLQQSNLELSLAYDATIEGWSRALDLRDKETEGHTRRVTEMAVRIARHLGIQGAELVQIRRGALLHDMGKMGVPDAILLKPGPLNEEEWIVMKRHPVLALEMLSPIAFLKPALDIPYCHHEKWDGTGYPRGLKGEQIPLSARIFAVADIWDALSSDRPYRKAWTRDRVVEHVRQLSGSHLDPQVVSAFMELYDDTETPSDHAPVAIGEDWDARLCPSGEGRP